VPPLEKHPRSLQKVMAVEAFGITLALLGAASIVAAIAGALNLAGVAEIPAMQSRALRVVLAVVGTLFLLLGFGAIEEARSTGTTTSSGPGPSGTTSDSPPSDSNSDSPRPSEYSNLANSACQQSLTQFAQLDTPPEGSDDRSFVEYTFTSADIITGLLEELSVLTPGAASSQHETLLFHLGNYRDSLEGAAVALRAGDPYGFDNGWEQALTYSFDFNRAAQSLSLNACRL
jgi:hypothetical protein